VEVYPREAEGSHVLRSVEMVIWYCLTVEREPRGR